MSRLSKRILSIYITVFFLIFIGLLNIVSADIQALSCTILDVKGQTIETSCQKFFLGEEVKITDNSGRPLMIFEIPLPSDADIKYDCKSKKDCSRIVEIQLHHTIKVLPE